jgi:hypothetical protein
VSLNGKVTAVAADGKSFTLETARTRGAAPRSVQVKLTERTRVGYQGVGPGGARPTVGYRATLLLEDGSPDTAGQVHFAGDAAPLPAFGAGGGGVGGGGLGGPPPDDPD